MTPGYGGAPLVPSAGRRWSLGWFHLAYAVAAAIGLAGLTALSLLFDARLETDAQGLSTDAVAWGRLLSALAKSGPLYAGSGLVTFGALLLRRLRRFRASADALTVVAERGGYALATLSASSLAAQAVKHTLGRARPHYFATLGPYHFNGLSAGDGFASFPSGHSTTAFAMATALSLLVPKLRVALFTLAAAIAASRVVVQAHYLSDIAAGTVLGVASALLVASMFARWNLTFTHRADGLVLKSGAPAPVHR